MLQPITMKIGTKVYTKTYSPKQQLQLCKQKQTASGNKQTVVNNVNAHAMSY